MPKVPSRSPTTKSSRQDTAFQEKKNKTSNANGISVEEYIAQKPDFPTILRLMKSEVLMFKPDDIALFLSRSFFKHENLERLMSSSLGS